MMSVLFEDTTVDRFTTECSLTYSSFIYCMMLNRIARGYSAQELSFLLGQDDDFVANLERFKMMEFSVGLHEQLCRIFQHGSFFQQQHRRRPKLYHEMHIWKAEDTILYRMECGKSRHESVILFQVTEADPATRDCHFSTSVEIDREQSQRVLRVMVENDVFAKPISGLELHQLIEYMVSDTIHPLYFKTELEKLAGRKGKAPLKRTKRRSYGYRYVLHPGVNATAALDFVHQKFDKL